MISNSKIHVGLKSLCDFDKCNKPDCHILILDCDDISLNVVREFSKSLIARFSLGNIHIIKTSKNSYHILSFVHRSFEEILVMCKYAVYSGLVGELFMKFSEKKHYFVTRLDQKNGFSPIHIESYFDDRFSMNDNLECQDFYFKSSEMINSRYKVRQNINI